MDRFVQIFQRYAGRLSRATSKSKRGATLPPSSLNAGGAVFTSQAKAAPVAVDSSFDVLDEHSRLYVMIKHEAVNSRRNIAEQPTEALRAVLTEKLNDYWKPQGTL